MMVIVAVHYGQSMLYDTIYPKSGPGINAPSREYVGVSVKLINNQAA